MLPLLHDRSLSTRLNCKPIYVVYLVSFGGSREFIRVKFLSFANIFKRFAKVEVSFNETEKETILL
jgi:hypothetical protein